VVAAHQDFVLSEGPIVPFASGRSIIYGLAAGEWLDQRVLVAVAGVAAISDREQSPQDAALAAAVNAALAPPAGARIHWTRLANITVRRVGDAIFITSRPAPKLSITRCDDLRDFQLIFGTTPDDGTLLGPAVRAFFANGGRRCWVATVRRPSLEDASELPRVRQDMVGLEGSSELEATGLERLLLIPEVTVVDAPDLYARRVDRTITTYPLPPSEREACFHPCPLPPKGTVTPLPAGQFLLEIGIR